MTKDRLKISQKTIDKIPYLVHVISMNALSFCSPLCEPILSCLKCTSAMENAAIASAANMGIPDCYYCGECGSRFETAKDLVEHLTC